MATWNISNYYKKSCHEVQEYIRDGDKKYLYQTTGWRFGTWTVTTTDDKIPELYWDDYGSHPDYSSLHLGSCGGSNVEDIELCETWDSCWEEMEYDESLTEDERDEIDRIIEEDGIWALADNGWDYGDCESYITGPVRVENEQGETVCILYADADGNTAVFDENKTYTFEAPVKSEPVSISAAWPFPTPKEES